MKKLDSLTIQKRQRRVEIIAVSVTILLGLVLRIARLPFLTMWSDEYHSFRVSTQPLENIISGNYGGELNPPLYFTLLHLHRLLFGDTEIAMRSLSLFFAFLSMILFLKLSYSIFESFIPSLGALILMAFHPILIYFSVEIRSYSLLVFLSLLSFLSSVNIHNETKNPGVWTFLLVLSLSGTLYTHHFGLIVPIAITAFVIAYALITKKWAEREILSLSGIVIAIFLYLPGFLMLQRQIARYPGQTNFNSLINSLQILSISIKQPRTDQILIALASISFLAGLITLIAQVRKKPNSLIVISGTTTAIIFILTANLAGINTTNRYLILVIPLVLIVMAATLIPLKLKWQRTINLLGAATITFYMIFGTIFVLNTKNENLQAKWKANWMDLSEVIEDIRRTNEPIAMMGWDATPIQYYLGEFAITSYTLEQQFPKNIHPSFLVVMTPNSRSLQILEASELIYEDTKEGISIFRLYTTK